MKAIALLLWLALAPAALAAGGGAKPSGPDELTAQARVHFRLGTELYRQARYREAIQEFEIAYKLRPHGVIFFNTAQCHERLGDLEAALSDYRRYLAHVPMAEDRRTVEAAMRSLEARIAAAKPPPPGAPPAAGLVPPAPDPQASAAQLGPPPDPTPSSARPLPPGALAPPPPKLAEPKGRTWTWVAAGAAAAALAVGVGYGLAARSASNDLTSATHDAATATRLRDQADGRARTANVLYGVAGTLGAAGVTLFFVEGTF